MRQSERHASRAEYPGRLGRLGRTRLGRPERRRLSVGQVDYGDARTASDELGHRRPHTDLNIVGMRTDAHRVIATVVHRASSSARCPNVK